MRNLGSQSNMNTTSNQANRSTIMKSSSQVLDDGSTANQISTGIANIPNQVHYHHSKRKINMNVLLFGTFFI